MPYIPEQPWWTDAARCPAGPHYFAVGPNHHILMSEDLGETWVVLDQVPSPQTPPPKP
jgi:hypothetical protein